MRGVPIKKVCPQCGKEFECLKSKETKFCSHECYINSKHTGTDIVCDNCGKTFYRRKYHIDRQKEKNQNNFCSMKCQKDYLHKAHFEFRECEICGALFEVSKLSKQRFCSDECQNIWQTKNVGELNPRFESILTPCSYCGKQHYVKPYKFKEQEHFFCSKECRQAWYAEIYSQTDEWKEKSRKRILEQFKNGSMSLDSKPQLIINDILDSLNITYEREKDFSFFSVDNYLIDYNLIIEVQGDYWHTNPLKFTSNLTDSQYDRIGRDKAKHSYIKNQYGIECLYLWESDILNNKELCSILIKTYIEHKGILEDYNSFNYSVSDGVLMLNDNIILPYYCMPSNQYKQLLNITM
jgi:endogenous inhibitor of DNA gyrase (YacG/DUF329 family)